MIRPCTDASMYRRIHSRVDFLRTRFVTEIRDGCAATTEQTHAYRRQSLDVLSSNVAHVLVSTRAASVSLPPFGTLGLDPSTLWILPPLSIPRATGVASLSFLVPNDPALIGLALYSQALVNQAPVRVRFTNVVADRALR